MIYLLMQMLLLACCGLFGIITGMSLGVYLYRTGFKKGLETAELIWRPTIDKIYDAAVKGFKK